MTTEEFLTQLRKALQALEQTARASTVQYYREILEDRMEEGLTEEAAVAEMEPIETIAADILSDAAARGACRPRRSGWATAMMILGSPLWLAWLLVLGALILAIYAVAWSVIVALFSAVAALGAGVLAGVFALFLYWTAYPMTGLFLLGAGFVCAALGIALFFPSLALARWLIRGTSRASKALWHSLFRKKEDAAS